MYSSEINANPQPEKPVYLALPEGLDVKKYLPRRQWHYAPYVEYWISTIFYERVFNRRSKDSYQPLKTEYLRNIFPRASRADFPAIKRLVVPKLIECDRSYSPGTKAMGYRLVEEWRGVKHRRVLVTCEELASKLRNFRAKTERRLNGVPVVRWMANWVQVVDFEADLPLYDLAQFYDLNDFDDCGWQEINIQNIRDGNRPYTVCAQGRFHSPFTRLNSNYRCYLSYQGQSLISIDVACCQPLLLGAMIKDSLRHSGKQSHFNTLSFPVFTSYEDLESQLLQSISVDYSQYFPVTSNNSNSNNHQGSHNTSLMMSTHYEGIRENESNNETRSYDEETGPKMGQKAYNRWERYNLMSFDHRSDSRFLPRDVLKYLSLCEDGVFYEYMMDRLGMTDRAAFKVMFFKQVFFGKTKPSRLLDVMTEDFPTVVKVVEAIKEKDHANMARLLQAFESSFMINGVCRRIMEERPDAFVLTIHDSILTTPEYVEAVQEIIRQEFRRLGLNPTLKITSE